MLLSASTEPSNEERAEREEEGEKKGEREEGIKREGKERINGGGGYM